MLSEMFYKLWNNGLIQLGVWETIYMTLISSAIAYVIGLPLDVLLKTYIIYTMFVFIEYCVLTYHTTQYRSSSLCCI